MSTKTDDLPEHVHAPGGWRVLAPFRFREYRLLIAAQPNAATQLQLLTLDGALLLQGQGEFVGAGAPRFQGEALAAPGREAALNNLLNIIGRRQGARSVITIGRP